MTKNHVTVARIPEGAIVEKPVKSEFSDAQGLSVLLHTPDFTTARRVADAINEKLGADSASAQNAACVRVNTALASPDDAVAVIAQIGALDVRQDDVARVIVNEKTGTVVIIEMSPWAASPYHRESWRGDRDVYNVSQPARSADWRYRLCAERQRHGYRNASAS